MAIIETPPFHYTSPIPIVPFPNSSFPCASDPLLFNRKSSIETTVHLLQRSTFNSSFAKPIDQRHSASSSFFSLEKIKGLLYPLEKIVAFFSTFSFDLPMAKAEAAYCHVDPTHFIERREKFEEYLNQFEQELEELKNGTGRAPLFQSLILKGSIDADKEYALNTLLLKETWTDCAHLIHYDSEESLKTLSHSSHVCQIESSYAACLEIDLKLKLYEIVYQLTEAYQNRELSTDPTRSVEKTKPLKEGLIHGALSALGGICGILLLKLKGLFFRKFSKNHRDHFEQELQSFNRTQTCIKISAPILCPLEPHKGGLTSIKRPMNLKPIPSI